MNPASKFFSKILYSEICLIEIAVHYLYQDENIDGDTTIKEDASKSRTPSTSQLFDGEADSKANVLKQAEELRKTGCKLHLIFGIYILYSISTINHNRK